MNQDPDHNSTRRILPNGRAMEILKLHLERAATRSLHICPQCTSPLVQPLEWHESRLSLWELTLHCPNCNWMTDGVFTQPQVDEFEEHLEEGLSQMLGDLTRLTQANMVEEVERFAAALRTDLLLPEDF